MLTSSLPGYWSRSATTLTLVENGQAVVFDRSSGYTQVLNPAAAMVWTALEVPGDALSLAESIADVTGASSEAVISDIEPLLLRWANDGTITRVTERESGSGREFVPFQASTCTRALDLLGWYATLVVDIGSDLKAGLRVSSAAALALAQAALPTAVAVGPADAPANVSFRWDGTSSSSRGRTELAVAYELCAVVERSEDPMDALAAALIALDRLIPPTASDAAAPLRFDGAALLGEKGIVLAPSVSRHWLALRRTELSVRGLSLLPKGLALLPGDLAVPAALKGLPASGVARAAVDAQLSRLEPQPVRSLCWREEVKAPASLGPRMPALMSLCYDTFGHASAQTDTLRFLLDSVVDEPVRLENASRVIEIAAGGA